MSNLSRSGARGLSVVPGGAGVDVGARAGEAAGRLPAQVSGLPQCVGRDAELEHIRELYDRACGEGHGRLLLVVGAAGVGKTRLTGEVRRRLRLEGIPVLEGRCLPGGRAYQPFIEIVQAALGYLADLGVGSEELQRASDLVSALTGQAALAAGDAGLRAVPPRAAAEPNQATAAREFENRRIAFFERVREFLLEVGRRRSPVLVMHDLHNADGSTRALALHLARTLCGAPELAIAESEVFRGLYVLTTREAPASDWFAGLAAEQMVLGGLDEGGVRAFLQSPGAVARIQQMTAGLPRALEAMLESRVADAGDLVRERLAGASPPAVELARALALLAKPAGADLLVRLASPATRGAGAGEQRRPVSDDPVPALVAELQALGLVARSVVDGELRIGFERTADREEILRVLPEADIAELHLVVGDALAAGGNDGDAAACAEHLLRGGAGERAVDHALAAGELLELAYAYDRAADLYERALGTTRRADVKNALRDRLCELYELVGEYGRALEHAEALRAVAPESAAVSRRIGHLLVVRGDLPGARAELASARKLAASAGNDDESVRVLADVAEAAFLSGDHEAALAAGHSALELGAAQQGRALLPVLIAVSNSLGKVALEQGDYALAASRFEKNLGDARGAGVTPEIARALINLGIASLRGGDHQRAERCYQEGLTAASEAGDHRHRAFCLQNLGVLAQWRRDYRAALGHYQEAVAAFKRIGHRSWLAWVALDLGDLYLGLGDAGHAQGMIEFAARLQGHGEAAPPTMLVILENLRGRIAVCDGKLAAAETHFASARAQALKVGNREELALSLFNLAQLALTRGDIAAARRHLGDLGDPPSRKAAAQAHLLEADVALVSTTVSGAAAQARAALEAAAAGYLHLGDPEGEMRARVRLAELLGAQGDSRGYERERKAAARAAAQVRGSVPEEFLAGFDADPDRRKLQAMMGWAGAGVEGQVEGRGAPADARPPVVPALPVAERPAPRFPKMIGSHRRMKQVFDLIERVAPYESIVLIRGESGTGKELVAEAIHESSPRRGQPFIKVNCGALVESLLLSELFGHERGSFTGALSRRKGRFELADGGTIFLDEIGDVSPKTQVALLRVLQEREFERVGGTSPIKVNVRIICATNRDLEGMVAAGTFREDLYYRLQGLQIELPPLRDRREDIPQLSEHFLERIARERGGERKTLAAGALEMLASYRWPGNIREFENVLRSVSLFADGAQIQVQDFADYAEIFRGESRSGVSQLGAPPASDSLAPATRSGVTQLGAPAPAGNAIDTAYQHAQASGLSLKELKRRIELECITRALADAGGNITRAADLLGMKRPRLSQLIKEHGIVLTQTATSGSPSGGVASRRGEDAKSEEVK